MAETSTDEFFSTSAIPDWAIGATIVTVDDGTTSDGAYGYECHRLLRDGREIGSVYDLGNGYKWVEGGMPEPYGCDERPSKLSN